MITQSDIDALVAYSKLILPERVITAVSRFDLGYTSEYNQSMWEAQYIFLGIKFFSTNTDATDLEKQHVYQCLLDLTGFLDVIQETNTLEQTGIDWIYQTEAKENSYTITGTGTITIYFDTTAITQSLSGATTFSIDTGYVGFKVVRMDFSNPETVTSIVAENNQMLGQLDLTGFENIETVSVDNNSFDGVTFGSFVDNANLNFSIEYNELNVSRVGAIIDQIEANSSAGIGGRVFDLTFNAFASRDKIATVDNLLSAKGITVNIQFIPQKPEINLIEAASATEVNLQWLDYSDNENAFLVERSVDETNWTEIAELAADTTSYSDTTVSGETTYFYRIRARAESEFAVQYSDYSNTSQVTTPSESFPITVTGGNKQITIDWVDDYEGELSWQIFRATASEGPYTLIATEPANTTQYIDTNLPISTTYWYQVIVTKSDSNQASSEIGSGTTNAGSFSLSFSSSFS